MNRKISISFAVVLYMVGFSVWAGTFEVHAPMVRMVPPGQAVSVAFLGLVNHGDKDRAIVAAYSDVASAVELHSHRMEDGVTKMGRVDSIPVPAKGEAVLAPGGFSIMLIGLTRTLELDKVVNIELELADGERVVVEAIVQMAGTEEDHSGHDHSHDDDHDHDDDHNHEDKDHDE